MTVVDFIFRHFRIFRFFRRPLYKELLRKKDGVDFFEFSAKMSWEQVLRKSFLGRPEGSGGGPGVVLGGPGALRGGPGGVLGGSWALLGRSWSDL